MYLAINPGGITTPLIGTATTDPAFGLPAHWIDEQQKEARKWSAIRWLIPRPSWRPHLSHLMQVQAARLLQSYGNPAVGGARDQTGPKLIEEVVPKMVSVAVFQKVLQLLLEEAVHIRDIRTIIESIAEHATSTNDPYELTRRIRVALAPAIVQQIYGPTRELSVIAIDPGLERLLVQALANTNGPALDPAVAETLSRNAAETAMRQEEIGVPACLLVPDRFAAPWLAWSARWPHACGCWHTVKFPKRTPFALDRFLKVPHYEHPTLYRPNVSRSFGQGPYGIWGRNLDSVEPPTENGVEVVATAEDSICGLQERAAAAARASPIARFMHPMR